MTESLTFIYGRSNALSLLTKPRNGVLKARENSSSFINPSWTSRGKSICDQTAGTKRKKKLSRRQKFGAGAYSEGVSRRLSKVTVGERDGTITSRSAYWLGPYLYASASSTTSTASSAESSPMACLCGPLTATGSATAPACKRKTERVKTRSKQIMFSV